MATEAQKKQFIMGNIVHSFQVRDEDYKEVPEYEIMSKLYDFANLNNNKELVKRLDKGRTLTGRIQNSVYLDVAYIIAEKIVEDKTGALKELYIKLFEEKYFNVKKIVGNVKITDEAETILNKTNKEVERYAILAILSLKYDIDEMRSLYDVASYFNFYESIFCDDNGYMDKHTMKLPDGYNVIETGAFEKYKTRRIKELCEYLGIEEHQFRQYFVEEMKIADNESGTLLDSSNGILEHIISSRLISNHRGGIAWASTLYLHNRKGRKEKPYEPDMDDVIDAYYTGLFIKYCADEEKGGNRGAMMREYKSDSPETDWRGLCHTYQQDRIVKIMMNMQRKHYEKFSFEHTSHKNMVAKYERIISELQSLFKVKEKEICSLQEEVNIIQVRKQSISDKNYLAYEQKIKKLQKQIEEQEKEIEKIKKHSADKDEYIELLEKDEDEILETTDEIDYVQLSKKKILFVGGLPETVNKILPYFSFKKHIGKDYAGSIDVSVVSDVAIFYDFLNHSLYYKIINIAREHKLNVIYCRGTNADKIISHIAKNISK